MPITKQILVIDDEAIVREAVTDILESIDINVLSAADGYAGLALFQTHHQAIHGILLDMKMPGLSGPETLRQLRRINAHVPIILSSGYSEEETKKAIADQEPAIFLPKPYNFDELIATVVALLASSE